MSKADKTKLYLRILWLLLLVPVASLLLFVWMVSLGVFGELPKTEELQNPKTNLASVVLSSDGKVLGKYYAENRVNVKFKDLPEYMVNALIATEDARFKEHSGVDGRGLIRVFTKTLIGGDQSSGGGSTLSQQLAKLLFPREKKSSKLKMVVRKIKEWIIAIRLERQYTKEEILTMYLNKFDFNYNAVGVKSAAQIYFDRSPDSLKIEQAAMLIGMAKNPSLFNPVRRPDTTFLRRNVVMNQMVKYGFLSQQKYDSLKQLPLQINFHREDHNEGLAPYFREYLRDEFLDKWCKENLKANGEPYDIYRDGLKIYTTIDSRMQRYAEEAVTEHLTEFQKLFYEKDLKFKKNYPFAWNVTKEEIKSIMHSSMKRTDRYRVLKAAGVNEDSIVQNFNTKIPMTVFSWRGEIDTMLSPNDSMKYYKSFFQTGFMSMDPHTGYVKAWVGGINHKHFKYDHVKTGRRQVGSTIKPFLYALAIQEGYSPCYKLPNVKTCIDLPTGEQWCPDNSDDKMNGKTMTLQKALALSVNYISAYLIKQFGPDAMVNLIRRMGITAPIDPVPSICLGTPELSVYEMVGANSTFANRGTWTEPVFITRIEDKTGKVLADFAPKTEEVFSEDKAYVMLRLMQGVINYGTGTSLRSRYKLANAIAGKTGTTQNQSDGWFMGITPDLVSGCWVGAEDRSVHFNSLEYGQGARMALPIWARYMQKVYADKKLKVSQRDFDKPAKKIDVEMDCSKYDNDRDDGDFDSTDD